MRKFEDILLLLNSSRKIYKNAYTDVRDYVFDGLLLKVKIYMKL